MGSSWVTRGPRNITGVLIKGAGGSESEGDVMSAQVGVM